MIRYIAILLMLALPVAPAMADTIDDRVTAGKSVYQRTCIRCHGANLRNSGNQSFDLRKFPAEQFTRFEDSVKNGKRRMPPWGDILSDEDIKALWAYVATHAGTQDIPQEAMAPFEDEEHSGLTEDPSGTTFDTVRADTLTVCVSRNGSAMSGWRHESGVGLDYRMSVALAEALDLDFRPLWYEADGGGNPILEPSALLSADLCDLVAGHPLIASAVGAPSVARGRMPEWMGRPDKTDPRRITVDLETLAVSSPFRREELGLVFAPSAKVADDASLNDLGGLTVGYQGDTVAEVIIRLGAQDDVRDASRSYPAGAAFLWRLETGDIDAALVEVSAYDFMLRQNAISKLRLGSWRHGFGINVGYAMLAEQDDLRAAVDDALADLVQSGVAADLAALDQLHYIAPKEPAMLPSVSLAQLTAFH